MSADQELKDLGYPQHILDGFSQGALLDLRVRFAMQLLTSPGFGALLQECKEHDARARNSNAENMSIAPAGIAEYALNVSGALFEQAEARGWAKPLDHETALPEEVSRQAQRIGAFEAHKQLGANKAMQAAQSPISALRRPGMN